MAQYAFHFDSNKCSGCKTCQVSCKGNLQAAGEQPVPQGAELPGGAWELNEAGSYVPSGVFGYFMSVACNHCDEPACFGNCPTGAIQKDEDTGIVWVDAESCIGCKACVTACPYDAPSFSEESGLVIKCDMCKDEVAAGGKPICVNRLSHARARFRHRREDMEALYGAGDVEVEPLPVNSTGPEPDREPPTATHRKTGSGTGALVNLEEEL